MQGAVRLRISLFLLGLLIVPLGTYSIILFAKGYRPDWLHGDIQPTGLLVATSYPNGAQVYVNGSLKSATDTTFNLAPGSYKVDIKKDGYTAWTKQLQIETEIVTRATAVLFPSVPVYKAVTAPQVLIPSLSPEGSRVAFLKRTLTGSDLYILDLSESPLEILNREARDIAALPYPISFLVWSPDSRQILGMATSSSYLVDVNTSQVSQVNPAVTLDTWNTTRTLREQQKLLALPPRLVDIFQNSVRDIIWSPKENKLLYTATVSAAIPDHLKKALPGSSTQKEERILTPGNVYIYDLEEDRNFKIDSVALTSPTPTPKKLSKSTITRVLPVSVNAGWSWFPTSSHLMKITGGQVKVVEYDGQNNTTVYPGPLDLDTAFPYPSGKQLLILATLPDLNPAGSASGSGLFAIPLR